MPWNLSTLRSNPRLGALVMLGVGWLALGAVMSWEQVPPVEPVAAISDGRMSIAMKTCAECHPGQCETFQSAPHNNTLTRTSVRAVRELFAGKSVTLPPDGVRYEFKEKNDELWLECDAYPEPLRVEWIFGSGSHARTPASVWRNAAGETELLEHRVSWYPGVGLDSTLGTKADHDVGAGMVAMGEWLNHDQARSCFACHVTALPTKDGVFDEPNIVTGVTCARCHVNAREHVAAMNAGSTTTHLADWKKLSPLESINRCGECHRRVDQLTGDDLVHTNDLLIRFAPAALAMSPCFLKQSELEQIEGSNNRLDCMTCHNPHRPATRDANYYVQKCLNCHGEQTAKAPVCADQPMTSQCLSCHMPAVQIHPRLKFTDHWIRVREPEQK